jgi:phosphoserine phosphatase
MKSTKTIKIAVFDLNQTVFNKSSKEEFFRFLVAKKPRKLLNLFQMGFYTLLKEQKLISKTDFKENFFHYLDGLEPSTLQDYAREYWSQQWPDHFNASLLAKIEELRQAGIQVYFITGALDIYVAPLFEHFLQTDGWLSTRTQYIKGRYKVIGKACKDEEKIRRLQQLLYTQPFEIIEAYSDKEEAVLQQAKKSFLVKNKEIIPVSDQ